MEFTEDLCSCMKPWVTLHNIIILPKSLRKRKKSKQIKELDEFKFKHGIKAKGQDYWTSHIGNCPIEDYRKYVDKLQPKKKLKVSGVIGDNMVALQKIQKVSPKSSEKRFPDKFLNRKVLIKAAYNNIRFKKLDNPGLQITGKTLKEIYNLPFEEHDIDSEINAILVKNAIGLDKVNKKRTREKIILKPNKKSKVESPGTKEKEQQSRHPEICNVVSTDMIHEFQESVLQTSELIPKSKNEFSGETLLSEETVVNEMKLVKAYAKEDELVFLMSIKPADTPPETAWFDSLNFGESEVESPGIIVEESAVPNSLSASVHPSSYTHFTNVRKKEETCESLDCAVCLSGFADNNSMNLNHTPPQISSISKRTSITPDSDIFHMMKETVEEGILMNTHDLVPDTSMLPICFVLDWDNYVV